MAEKKIGDKVIRLVRGDITNLEVEAFVYDITADAKLGTGYGGAISQRGGPTIQKELSEIGSCPTGEAIVTSAGKMKAKHIIHVNGPKFFEPDTEGKLRRADPGGPAAGRGKGNQAARVSTGGHRSLPGPARPVRAGDGGHRRRVLEAGRRRPQRGAVRGS